MKKNVMRIGLSGINTLVLKEQLQGILAIVSCKQPRAKTLIPVFILASRWIVDPHTNNTKAKL
jgi:hypothetical protein